MSTAARADRPFNGRFALGRSWTTRWDNAIGSRLPWFATILLHRPHAAEHDNASQSRAAVLSVKFVRNTLAVRCVERGTVRRRIARRDEVA
jgi:hypothetical protein